MVITENIRVGTIGNCDILNLTDRVRDKVALSGIFSGTVTVFATGSTAGVTTIEFEPGLIQDFTEMWERIVSAGLQYDHNERWKDGNGYAHVRASLLGPSLVVPFSSKKLLLGTWQQIILVDFDNRPRQRDIILQIMGD